MWRSGGNAAGLPVSVMDWHSLLCTDRYGEVSGTTPGRSPYQRDHDRILFSPSFRRLDSKTQVWPLAQNDNVHTRLSHCLEVACVGRSLGQAVGEALQEELPETIAPVDIGALVQAACLAHDIGNPPFGHAAESIIREWFREGEGARYLEGMSPEQANDLLGWEGNAQGFRILTNLEGYPAHGGMRLTYATLGAVLKYPWTSALAAERKGKFSLFQSELATFRKVVERLGLSRLGDNEWARSPFMLLMEAADDICYAVIDLEDGVEQGVLRFEEVEQILLKGIGDRFRGYPEECRPGSDTKLGVLRGLIMDALIDEVTMLFLDNKKPILDGSFGGGLLDHGADAVCQSVHEAKAVARERLYDACMKGSHEIGAANVLQKLLHAFMSAASDHVAGRTQFRSQRLIDLLGRHAPQPGAEPYEVAMSVLDYIGGMTDQYAVRLAREFDGQLG